MRRMRTYTSVWKVPKMLYGIQDIAFPMPISYRQIGFFIGGVGLMWGLDQFPPFSFIGLPLVEYLVIPGFISWFFTKQLLDGKAPHRFILRWIAFQLSPHEHNRYKEMSRPKNPYRYCSLVGYRKLSVTEGGQSHD
ncbi:conjugal transfer protein [Ammoniphilus sp. YIM 78166]|uniref:conjugal transfer protein n=1 Tax=Ammoniphilus sp. YIM 78166 TaxID=1644106 RepID=UPI00106FFFDB|nr:conjugal transfer protein [Ammoniphilus sp. YIM 78166]